MGEQDEDERLGFIAEAVFRVGAALATLKGQAAAEWDNEGATSRAMYAEAAGAVIRGERGASVNERRLAEEPVFRALVQAVDCALSGRVVTEAAEVCRFDGPGMSAPSVEALNDELTVVGIGGDVSVVGGRGADQSRTRSTADAGAREEQGARQAERAGVAAEDGAVRGNAGVGAGDRDAEHQRGGGA